MHHIPPADWTYSPDIAVERAVGGIAGTRPRNFSGSLHNAAGLLDRLDRPQENLADKMTGPQQALPPVFLDRLEQPQKKMPPVFHAAGTNGKGSVLAFLQAMIEAAGLSAHKYTSPHLVRFEERIVLNGRDITPQELLPLIDAVHSACEGLHISFFEFVTAVAFLAFAQQKADAVLLETGLGGRYDTTNAVASDVAILTRISFDHMNILGDTLTAIATDKAGIIKPGKPCIVAEQPPEAMAAIEQAAKAQGAPLFRAGREWRVMRTQNGFSYHSQKHDLHLPLPALQGAHQIMNAGCAIAALEQSAFAFLLQEDIMARAMQNVVWPGRLQRLKTGPLVDIAPADWEIWIDGAHNDSAAEVLAAQATDWGADKPLHMVTGMKQGKDTGDFYGPLRPFLHSVTIPDPKFLNAPMADLAEIRAALEKAGYEHIRESKNLESAVEALVFQYKTPQRILITGSLYLAGYVLRTHA